MNYRNPIPLLDVEQFIKPMGATIALKHNTTVECGQFILKTLAVSVDKEATDNSHVLTVEELEDRTVAFALSLKEESAKWFISLYNRAKLQMDYQASCSL